MELKLDRVESLQDRVVRLIKHHVTNGDWPVGSKLPTEQALCTSLGVSRTLLREAIAKLKSQGLLESRQGSGVFVLREAVQPVLRIDDGQLERIEALRSLMELRFGLELDAAYLAALRRTEAHLKALRKAHARLISRVADDSMCINEDVVFHELIAEATRNTHFQQFLQFIMGQIGETVAATNPNVAVVPGRAARIIREHEAIVESIAAGDPVAARRAAWMHQINAARRMGIRGLLAWENLRMSHLQTPYHSTASEGERPLDKPLNPLPKGSCDTHVTLLGSPSRYGSAPNGTYSPHPGADLAAYQRLQSAMGNQRAIFIQPSIYGGDNSLLLDSLREGGSDNYRGVAAVQPDAAEASLEEFHQAGVRGARVNTLYRNGVPAAKLPQLAERIKSLGWHIDLQADVSEFPDLYGALSALDAELVIDHMGHIPCDLGVNSAAFQDVLRLLRENRVWVRLSGFIRLTTRDTLPFSDIRPFVDALIEARPDRLLWGSNWPQPAVEFEPPLEAAIYDQFAQWVGDKSLLEQILVHNPDAFYWQNG